MKYSTFLLLFVIVCVLSSCKKKKNPSPSIVGTWVISDISGSYGYKSGSASELTTTTYSYSGSILTERDTTYLGLVTVNNETWAFNSDGTFSIWENYQSNAAGSPVTDTLTGWWDYTGNTVSNSSIVLRTIGTPTILPMGGAFAIKSVTNTQLILTVDETTISSVGATTIRNIQLTFARR